MLNPTQWQRFLSTWEESGGGDDFTMYQCALLPEAMLYVYDDNRFELHAGMGESDEPENAILTGNLT